MKKHSTRNLSKRSLCDIHNPNDTVFKSSLQSYGTTLQSHTSSVFSVDVPSSPHQAQVLVDPNFLEEVNILKKYLESEKRITQYTEPSGKLWIEECLRVKEELSIALVALEYIQKKNNDDPQKNHKIYVRIADYEQKQPVCDEILNRKTGFIWG